MDERRVFLDDLRRAAQCPASWPTPGPTSWADTEAAPGLNRWKAVRDAIEAWHSAPANGDALETAFEAFDDLDPVNRDICAGLVRTYVSLASRGDPLSLDPPPSEHRWRMGDQLVILRAQPTFMRRDEPVPVYLKLRTGKQITEPDEAAVLVAGGPSSSEFADLRLVGDGDEVPLRPAPDQVAQQLEALTSTYARLRSVRPSSRELRPGRWCYGCLRLPYCGHYPPQQGRWPPTNARLVFVSKTGLGKFQACERRAAWATVHQVPADDPANDRDREHDAATASQLAHSILAETLVSGDEAGAIERASEEGLFPDVARYVQNAFAIADEPGGVVDYRATELMLGTTFCVETGARRPSGKQERLVVAFLAQVDATGREPDGTPTLVDLKTTESEVAHERDLYAVLGWEFLKQRNGVPPQRLVVRHHRLQRPQPSRVDRVVYDAARIDVASNTLMAIAQQIAQWDSRRADEPAPLAARESLCFTCEFSERCKRFGGPG